MSLASHPLYYYSMKIAVIGSGYVGTTTAVLLAAIEIKTVAVDIDTEKVEKLNSGKAPFYEAGLDELVKHSIDNQTLTATTEYSEALAETSVVVSSVGTPDKEDGSPNLEYVFAALEDIAKHATQDIIYVQKSTVPVGTGRKIIEHWAKHSDRKMSYVSAPEFLREGTAVVDSIEPDRIVVGGDDEDAKQTIAKLFVEISDQRKKIADISKQTLENLPEPEIHSMGLESAELTKVTANAFLSLKISFANSIAKLADASGADVLEVVDAIGADTRIGRAFLNAGRGYGGGCFPKDVSGLISSAAEFGVSMDIMESSREVNDKMPHYIIDKLEKEHGSLDGTKIAVLGLAFKAGTSDTRKSPGIKLARLLSEKNAKVTAYDPEGLEEAKPDLHESVIAVDTIDKATRGAEVVVAATDWPEIKSTDPSALKSTGAKILVDAMNMFDPDAVKDADLLYIGVGRS